MIIFNEKEYVEKNYLKKDFCIKTSDELNMIIRYYIYQGKNITDIRDILKETKRTKTIDIYLDDDYVFTGVFMRANSRPLRVAEPVWVTKYEYDFVKTVGDAEKEKILFALIVIRKILGYDSVYLTLNEIKKYSLTQKAQATLHKVLDELEADGYITIFEGKRYRVNIDKLQAMKSENYICIDNFDNIMTSYLKSLKADEYFYCIRCGRKTKYDKDDIKSHKKRKYCGKCALKIRNGCKK